MLKSARLLMGLHGIAYFGACVFFPVQKHTKVPFPHAKAFVCLRMEVYLPGTEGLLPVIMLYACFGSFDVSITAE